MNRHQPLSAEERALAHLLAAAPSEPGPSAELDARILALARADASEKAPARPAPHVAARPAVRRRRRTFAGLAVAASMVLAVGMAWQQRPLPTAQPVYNDGSVTMETPAPASTPARKEASPQAAIPAASPASLPAPAPPPAPARPTDAAVAAKPSPRSTPAPRIASPPPAAADVDKPVWPQPAPAPINAEPLAVPPPAPPAPPPPPAIASPALAPAPVRSAAPASDTEDGASMRLDEVTVTGSRAVPMVRAKRADASPAPLLRQNADATEIAAAVDADSRLSRRQWLHSIRQRQHAGDLETARASLQRFVHTHPRAVVPADLKPLLER